MADLNRRDFLAAAASMAAACALCGAVAEADDDAPTWTPSKDLPPEKFDFGKADDFAHDSGSDKFALDHQILITRKEDKIIALTAVCTHKKALVKMSDDPTQYVCPRHGSRFTLDGDPTPKPNKRMGPAHEPLVHYAISIDDKHHITVDTGTSFTKDKWGDAHASVDVKDK